MLGTINNQQKKLGNFDIVKLRKRILSTITIASMCGQAINYDEIALMLPSMPDRVNIEEFIQSDLAILDQITIHDRLTVLKGYEHLFQQRTYKEQVSKGKMQTAIVLANSLLSSRSYVKLLAVCGSVAYGTATENVDIDLFLVSQENRMWITFTKTLILARLLNSKRPINGEPPYFCLSYVQDEKNFEQELASHEDLMFAREFLSIKVLAGQKYYHELLSKANWLKETLPVLYCLKLSGKDEVFPITESYLHSKVLDTANVILYALIGNYLRFKASSRNLRLKKKGKTKDLFEAKITKGSCVYNSERYRDLERIYTLISK